MRPILKGSNVRCIFVLDIFNGAVVHAVRGERSRYELIDRYSKVVTTSDPIGLLQEIRPKEVYVADLNRIMGKGDNLATIAEISDRTKTMADIGVSNISESECLPKDVVPVLGTETAPLSIMEEAAANRDVVVSIDMLSRKVLTRDKKLANEPLDILRMLNGLSLEAIILLELDRVGTSVGLDREFLESAISVSHHPLILGGGVKSMEDLQTLNDLGFQGALVATAVHNRSIHLDTIR